MSKKIITILILVAIVTLFVGYATGRAIKTYEVNVQKQLETKEKSQMDQSKMMEGMEMKHEQIAVAPNRVNPKISVVAEKDMMGGYNLHIITTAFWFSPQNVGKAAVQNSGHAHVFVNGVKIGRAYSEWYYVGPANLQDGTNTITVALTANNHADWITKDGKEIKASIDVVK